MKAGFSKINITPTRGTLMAGQLENCYVKGTESELFATAMCLKQKDVTLVMVSCDVLFMSNKTVSEIRDQAESKLGIPTENVIICKRSP